jgi:hypothetical protein
MKETKHGVYKTNIFFLHLMSGGKYTFDTGKKIQISLWSLNCATLFIHFASKH